MKIKEAAAVLRKNEYEAWIRRLNWKFMDERIQNEFNNCKLDASSVDELGMLYLGKVKDDSKEYKKYLSTQYINATHIVTGSRYIDIKLLDKEKGSLIQGYESSAQLWYSQGTSGDVIVFVGPYKSKLCEMNENDIIIGRYRNPYQVNELVIKKHFSIFFRYCTCTSYNSTLSFKTYLYRQYLVFNDLRFKARYLQKIIKVGERVLIVALSTAAVLVSLYVGGKL